MGPMSSGFSGEANFQARGSGIENGNRAQPPQRRQPSPRQPDPMQTSMGYINVGGPTTLTARARTGGRPDGRSGAGAGGGMRDGNRTPGNKRSGKSGGGMPNGNKAPRGGGKRGGKR
jgi:23S rRNA pseudouridine2605 synthase